MRRALLLSLAVLSLHAMADEATIRKVLTERYPNLAINSVTPTPVPGIFEVWGSGKLFYTDEKGDYILLGPLVDTATRTNLTQERLEELTAVKFDTLPLNEAFPIVKGKGERKLAVFSDPECPFCRRLEKELDQLDNVTIYLFLYPIPELHPKAPEIARDVWCSPDRAKAWDAYLLQGKAPAPAPADCQDPIKEIAALGAKLSIQGTPAVIFDNGKRINGYVPVAKIEEMLKGGS
jgi:thiol:disulfide interchange protein DsbC